jgi:pimeloyl-ACP methyl ester carboxylesterase
VLRDIEAGDVVAVGHSTGGCIVQAMALADPSRLAGLALSGTWLKPNRYMEELFRSRLALLRRAPREYAAHGALMAYPPDWLDRNWPRFEAALAAAPLTPQAQTIVAERIAALLAFDGSAEVARIRLPQLILGAEDDLIVPAFLQRALAEALPAAEMTLFPSGGHFFPITRADAFVERLTAWIATL